MTQSELSEPHTIHAEARISQSPHFMPGARFECCNFIIASARPDVVQQNSSAPQPKSRVELMMPRVSQ